MNTTLREKLRSFVGMKGADDRRRDYVEELADQVVDGVKTIPVNSRISGYWRLMGRSPLAALEAAPVVFMSHLIRHHSFGIVGTNIGKYHPLRGGKYHDFREREALFLSRLRLKNACMEARHAGLGRVTQGSHRDGETNLHSVFVFEKTPWKSESIPAQGPRSRLTRIQRLAFMLGYEFEQESVITNIPTTREIVLWGWGGWEANGRRKRAILSPDRLDTWNRSSKVDDGSDGDACTTARSCFKHDGWRLLWSFLGNKHRFKEALGSEAVSEATARSRHLVFRGILGRDGAPTWRIRPMAGAGVMVVGLKNPYADNPAFALAVRLAEKTNWPVVLEPEDGGSFLEEKRLENDTTPYLGVSFYGEEIRTGTYILEPPSWEFGDFDFERGRKIGHGL